MSSVFLFFHLYTLCLTIASAYLGFPVFLVSAHPDIIFLPGFETLFYLRARGAVLLDVHGLRALEFAAGRILNLIAVRLRIPLPLNGNRLFCRG